MQEVRVDRYERPRGLVLVLMIVCGCDGTNEDWQYRRQDQIATFHGLHLSQAGATWYQNQSQEAVIQCALLEVVVFSHALLCTASMSRVAAAAI